MKSLNFEKKINKYLSSSITVTALDANPAPFAFILSKNLILYARNVRSDVLVLVWVDCLFEFTIFWDLWIRSFIPIDIVQFNIFLAIKNMRGNLFHAKFENVLCFFQKQAFLNVLARLL